MKIRLICIQTFHAHWAGHSGYHHYLSRLEEDFNVEHIRIPRGVVSHQELKGFEKIFFRLYALFARGRVNSWTTEKDLLAELRLWNRVRQEQFKDEKTVFHFLDGEIGYNFSGAIRKFLGTKANQVRLIASYHQPVPILEKVLPFKKRSKELDLILTVGRSQLPFFDFLPTGRVQFMPHGIDTDYFQPGKRQESSNQLYCLTVGHWLRDFDALEQLIRLVPERVIFRIVAGKDHIMRFRGMDNVELYSGIGDDELLRLYQRSDIGLMPLQDSTANNGLLEMMACGLPIVATRVGSVTDYVPEGAGILLMGNKPTALLAAVQRLADSPADRSRFGEAARRRALELGWTNIAREMAELYRRV